MTCRNNIHRRIWIFDFDGTLAPIVADRHAAQMHPACREFLCELSGKAGQCVAILSSRRLEDLQPRIDIPNVYLGGYNGLKWITPQGRELEHAMSFQGDLQKNRREMLPAIAALKSLPGLDIEDKHWSVTLHLRRMPPDAKEEAREQIRHWQTQTGIRILQGPEAWEIIFSPFFNKSIGLQILCRELKFASQRDLLIYAGDDENDALAMEVVASWGGINISAGCHPLYAECRLAENPEALVRLCREIADEPQGKARSKLLRSKSR